MVRKFDDGSEITSNVVSGPVAMQLFQIHTLITMLEMEIKFPDMKMSRHMTALNGAENVSGLTFGRGVSGRKKALEWAINQREELEKREVRPPFVWKCDECDKRGSANSQEWLEAEAQEHCNETGHVVGMFKREQ